MGRAGGDQGQSVGRFLVEVWLPAAGVTLRPTTRASYAVAVRAHLAPAFDDVPIRRLKPPEINAFYGRLLAGHDGRPPLAASTVRRLHAVLHRALRDAVRWGLLSTNPADGADPPRGQRPELRPWGASELAAFLRASASDRWLPLWVFLAFTGTRRGEALALRWRDVDLTGRSATVRAALVCADHRAVFGEPKTARGRRTIAIDDRVVSALRERQSATGASTPDDLVFCRENGGPLNPEMVTRWFKAAVRSSGVRPIRLHDLRHTHATLALAAGIDTKVISVRLGHATAAFTADVYQHLLPGMDREAAGRIADLVANAWEGTPSDG